MLFTSAQYKKEKENYIFSGSPITASKTLCEVTRGDNTLRQIVDDTTFESMVVAFEGAANEAALNSWFSGLLTAVDPTTP